MVGFPILRTTGLRSRAGTSESARNGYLPHHKAPFGVMLEKTPFNGKLRNKPVPDPVESETVRVMVQLYLGGDGAQSVARQLNERDLLHRGRPWNRDAVLSVLGNPAIAGKILWGRTDRRTGRVRPDEECIAIPLEPIIDQTTFDRIAPLA